ncbi:putative cytochrome p450 [Lyophyllum shimeji]|uniref:Cytochrome p450 n=1 Tax=Lyophyllum shimeji TaxID=47721 RepID=A0A9P3PGD0_LYOSH|nr:putative cytochrome p450 [Lyophyllum shimeji]
MDSPPSFVSVFAISVMVYAASSLFKAWVKHTELHHIPAIGPSGMFSSYMGAIRMLKHGRDAVQEGYKKYRGAAFKVPGISKWIVVVSGPQMVEDLRKATDDQVSFRDAVADVIQIDYTIGRELHYDPYHIGVIRGTLTRRLAERFADVQDEIVTAFAEHIPPSEGWTKVRALPTIMKIVCRTSNRLFVGLPLCRDPDFLSLNVEFTVDVMKAANIINLFPNFLKPIAGRLFSNVPKAMRRAQRHLRPIIEERLRQEERHGKEWPERPDDYLSWLLDLARGHQRTLHDLTVRILAVNFAAIHTTSMAFTQVLFDLAAYPSYVPALREEVEAVVREEGLTKTSLYKMRKVDSFIKESQRMGGNGTLVMQRKTLKDFTFSDGTVVPKGHTIAVANFPMHHDEANYTDPDRFDGFRFANMRDSEVDGYTKHQMVSLGSDYIVFGHGRHACPGRFFAVNELKALLTHVLLHYDLAFENNGGRPEDRWYGHASFPDPAVSVMFRKRQC